MSISPDKIKELQFNAEHGDTVAQYRLGLHYSRGTEDVANWTEAAKWYRKAADQGHAGAQCNLGIFYDLGKGVAKDEAEATKWYRKAADQGNAIAQCNLGICYNFGKGVAKDETEAVNWYRKAADQGHAQAQFNLGVFYANGKGVAKDETEAVNSYRKAADQGDASAQYWLAYRALQSEDFSIIVNQNNELSGFIVRSKKAFEYASMAAERNYAPAQYLLGDFFRLGYGVSANKAIALNWYAKAAQNGYEAGQWRLNANKLINEPWSEPLDCNDESTRIYLLQSIRKPAMERAKYAHIAQKILGDIHYDRAFMCRDDSSRLSELNLAISWYMKSASAGDKEAKFLHAMVKRRHTPSPSQQFYDKVSPVVGAVIGLCMGILIIICVILFLIGIFDGSGGVQYEDPWNEEPMLSPR